MNNNRKLLDSLENFRKAFDKLDAALNIPRDRELVLEGTVQRFETVVELVWKTLQRGLKFEGIHPKTPRETMKKGFSSGWLSDEIVWQELLDNRNSTSHEYLDESFLDDYYEDIVTFHAPIKELLEFLEARFNG